MYTPLPAGLVDSPPGPQLFALLAGVDRASCNGYQLVQVMAARARLLSWLQSQLLLDAREVALAQSKGPQAAPTRSTQTDPHAPDEIACALGWSTYAADELLGVSAYLAKYAPALFDALAAGTVDLYKVKLILKEVQFLDADMARQVIDRLLPGIATRTPETIRDQARHLVLTHDADAARKRYDRSVAHRQVTLRAQPDGTATLTGRHLPADKAAAAYDYLNRMATATKRAGDPANTPTNTPANTPAGASADSPAGPDPRRIDQLRADILLDLLAGADPTRPASHGGAGAARPAPRPGTVNLTVDLTTLLCLNEHAGELAGFGPIVADLARDILQQQAHTLVWRLSVSADGRFLSQHRLHRRPTADQIAYIRARDRVCQFPTCRRPAHQCQTDHILDWANNGISHEDNLQTACQRHNLAKTTGQFQAHRIDDGVLWISPRGLTYPTRFNGREFTLQQRRLIQHLVDAGETKNLYHQRN